jgi:hypothetical protein
MKNVLGERRVLDVIRLLSEEGASGRLHVSTGMTEGALAFDSGKLVEAQVGKLKGFQAINALASVPDATYDFDPAIQPPVQSSITAKERLLLKDFFGIDAAEPEETIAAYPEDDDEATLVRTEPAVTEPRIYPAAEPRIRAVEPLAKKSVFRPAVFAALLAVLAVVAVLAVYRLRKPDSTASAVPTVQTAPPVDAAPEPTNETTSKAPEVTANVPDLSGNWSVVNTVEQTSYQAYKNMQVGFNVSINQSGKAFTGTGQKISENGRSLPADSRTPIVVRGRIDGDKVEATFSESGAARKTNGRFVWKIDRRNGGLNGRFVSNAARSSGKSAATKEL